MDHAAIVAEVLASPAGRSAVEQQNVAALIRMTREAIGWRQADLAKAAGYSQPTISRLELGQGRINDTKVRAKLADVLGLPKSSVGLTAEQTSRADERTVADMRRAELLRGLVGAAATLALPREISSGGTHKISDRVVVECRAALDRLFEMDEQHGGATVYALAGQMVTKIRTTLTRASHSMTVGRDLRSLAASTAEHAGWLAFDAGNAGSARRWWLEALHMSDLASNTDTRITALTSMALHACTSSDPADGREAVELVDAAKGSRIGKPSHRLLSLLNARQAFGYARTGDAVRAASLLVEAERLLDGCDQDEDEPTWLQFWGPADLQCHAARSFIALGQFKPAQTAARNAITMCDQSIYPRNHAIYSTVLASALARDGQVDKAISASTSVIAKASTFGSRRIVAEAHDIVGMLDRRRGYKPAESFVAWARQLLPAA